MSGLIWIPGKENIGLGGKGGVREREIKKIREEKMRRERETKKEIVREGERERERQSDRMLWPLFPNVRLVMSYPEGCRDKAQNQPDCLIARQLSCDCDMAKSVRDVSSLS